MDFIFKTPVRMDGSRIRDARGWAVAESQYDGAAIVQAINAHDALVAACRLAKEHLGAMRLESGMGNVMLPFERAAFEQADNVLTAAIAKAEGESGAQ